MKPDLVLMDYSMPHINGIEATRYIKQFQNPPLVIIVTSNDTPECKAQAKAAGADGFVVKGGDLHDRLRLVGQCQLSFTSVPIKNHSGRRHSLLSFDGLTPYATPFGGTESLEPQATGT